MALAHFREGIAAETIEFRRGQLLYWGAQAAAAEGHTELRAQWLAALVTTSDPQLARLRRRAKRQLDGAVHALPSGVNLLLADAF